MWMCCAMDIAGLESLLGDTLYTLVKRIKILFGFVCLFVCLFVFFSKCCFLEYVGCNMHIQSHVFQN